MMKSILMATAAGMAMIAAPAVAQNGNGGPGRDSVDLEIDVEYDNHIDTSITTDVVYNKFLVLFGGAFVRGIVDVDSSAVAVTDAKQLQEDVRVNFREENELNGENGYVDPVFGPGWSEAGLDPNDDLDDGMPEGQIRVGFFAPVINTVDTFDVEGSGNIGVNLAAGYFNDQMNAASIAVSSNANPEAAGGWAEASTTALQSQLNVAQFATPGEILSEDDPEQGGGFNNFRDRNTIMGATITGSGNIGVNAAAGSLNQQANLMTLAVANDTTLAEANAGLMQVTSFSFVEQQDSINTVSGLSIAGASGNIGVNFAAGVGNQQLNSLTIAASQGGATPPDGGNGGGGDPS